MIAAGGFAFLGWMGTAGMMWGLHLYQYKKQNATVVDLGWAGSIGVLAVLYAWVLGESRPIAILAGAMGVIWSLRLTLHLYYNRMRGKPEDGRYRDLRSRWGDKAQLRFFLLFQFQALLAVLFSIPFLVIVSQSATPPLWAVVLGVLVWTVAVVGETVADRQLARFKNRHEDRKKTCRDGLWRYSRHPNYFFEWLHWWTYAILAWGAGWGFWVNLLFPIVMLFFILKVSGIPPTEDQALRSRGEDYRRYQETTNAFWPWFPKESVED